MTEPVPVYLHAVSQHSDISPIKQVLTTTTGGRAVGDGETNADQQFFFDSKASLTGGIGFPVAQNSVNNGVGPGNQCLTLNADGFVSNTPCAPPLFTPEQTWFVGGGGAAPAPKPPAPSPAPPAPAPNPPAPAPAPSAPAPPPPAPAPTSPAKPEKFVLPVPAEKPGTFSLPFRL